MFRLGKRGDVDIEEFAYFTTFEFFLAILVGLALLIYVKNVASGTLFEQNFLARDTGLLIDTIYASPGEVHVVYDSFVESGATAKLISKVTFSKPPSQVFSFSFGDSKSNVFSTAETLEQPASYLFGQDSSIKLNSPSKVGQNISFIEENGELKIDDAAKGAVNG